MSFPLPSFDSRKRKQNRSKILNTTIPEFGWNELSDKEVIGSGSFSSVITAKYDGKTIVVKKLLEQHEQNVRLFYKEANILHSLEDHLNPNIDPSRSVQGKDILQGNTHSLGDVDRVPHSVEHDLSSTSASGSSSTVKKPSFIFIRDTKEFPFINPEIIDPDITEDACKRRLHNYIQDCL